MLVDGVTTACIVSTYARASNELYVFIMEWTEEKVLNLIEVYQNTTVGP